MEDRQKKLLIGAVALGVLGAGVFWASTASAALPKTIPELLDRTHTENLTIPPSMFSGKAALLRPDAVAGSPTGKMWVKARQAEGLEVYISANALEAISEGTVTLLAVPPAVAAALNFARMTTFARVPAL